MRILHLTIIPLVVALLVYGCIPPSWVLPKIEDPSKPIMRPSYSVLPPRSGIWRSSSTEGIGEYSLIVGRLPKDTGSKTLTVTASVNEKTLDEPFRSFEEFKIFIEKGSAHFSDPRYQNKITRIKRDPRFSDLCLFVEFEADDYAAYNRGSALFLRVKARSYFFVHPDNKHLLIEVSFSERGLPSELMSNLDQAASGFFDGFRLKNGSKEGMVFIKGGCFQMGDFLGVGQIAEKPLHEVCVDDFYLDRHEVTQKDYREKTGTNPSTFTGNDLPVENISWEMAKNYCDEIGKRLPTEAEWEYAARSRGKNLTWAESNSEDELSSYCWYNKNSEKRTHPVASKQPNALGLYDMCGNVFEWVYDAYSKDNINYRIYPKNNPSGSPEHYSNILRGGSWYHNSFRARNTSRTFYPPGKETDKFGFRCARD